MLTGLDCVVYGVRRRPCTELSARIHRVGVASHHSVCVCLPGGSLFLVHLRDCSRRALPLFRHRHQEQRWQPGQRVLHGQRAYGKSSMHEVVRKYIDDSVTDRDVIFILCLCCLYNLNTLSVFAIVHTGICRERQEGYRAVQQRGRQPWGNEIYGEFSGY